ncbi:MAG: amino acid adenylation domain-containing protein [Bacteroidetes bacterium]|nr:amino acid adenylation domain-containing protein [Bacteroidota bacterium]
MNKVEQLLLKLKNLDVKTWIDDEQLCYDAPSNVMTEKLLTQLRVYKKEIIEILKNNINKTLQLPAIIPNKEKTNKTKLSINQKQLWFFSELHKHSSLYNIPGAIHIKGVIDIKMLEDSLNKLVTWHDSLRTIFEYNDGEVYQKVLEGKKIILLKEDLTYLDVNERKSTALKLAQIEAKKPFNFSNGLLFRPKLWILNDTEYILQITIHHIIADAWSMGVLMKNLLSIYEKYHQNKEHIIEKGNIIQYKDFAIWQNKIINKELLSYQLEYWKKELDSIEEVMKLPLDRVRPNEQSFNGKIEVYKPKKKLCYELKNMARAEHTTIFQILLTAFQVLIYRYTGQKDSVIGFLSANRRYETDKSIGYFVNTVPLRTNFSDNPSFKNLLLRNRDKFLKALLHSDVPFSKIVKSLKINRNLKHNPIFQVLVAHEPIQRETSKVIDIEFNYFLVDYDKSKFDLTLFIEEDIDSFKILLEYNTDIFEKTTIKNMLTNFNTLLENIVTHSESKISDIPILSKKESDKILLKWNDTFSSYPSKKTLHGLFQEQVNRTPNIIATIGAFEGKDHAHLTYQELNYKSNQLAHYLKDLVGRVDSIVGVFLDRSIEMVVTLLGILKSGCAYLPLDTEYPAERIDFLLNDANISILITNNDLIHKLPEYKGKIINIDNNVHIKQYSCVNPDYDDNMAENAAYVIYTSGSTGKPKGVMNTHKGICNRLLWMQETFRLKQSDRVLQKTSCSFDVSVWEFFWPLISGACLVIAKPGGHRDVNYLISTIVNNKITTIHFVPSMLQFFLEDKKVQQCNKMLKRVICSGETLTYKLQNKFFDKLNVSLYNLYGPTEAAVDVTWWECKKKDNLNLISVPIGKPIANTQLYILDNFLQPLPVGIPGEVYIGGANLAKGYLNRSELTEQKFIKNPFNPYSKLYKTGDLARFLPDGNIEFIGRLDYQVKVKGFRVELGEIESVIRDHSSIKDVVVISKEDIPGTNILIAYIIVLDQNHFSINELRSYLKIKLPDYMIPLNFMVLETFPLNTNGKIERNRFPIPQQIESFVSNNFVSPETDVEKILANIWSSVLKVKRISIYDNFFELGGDSIRSLQVLYMAKEKKLKFTLQDIFKYQTIASIAKVLKQENITDCHHKEKAANSMKQEKLRQ